MSEVNVQRPVGAARAKIPAFGERRRDEAIPMSVTPVPSEWRRDDFVVTTDRERFDLDVIFDFLANRSYWSHGIPRKTFERSLANSLGFALLHGKTQIGFARVISDFATVAYLGDVFVVGDYRGRGLAKWLMDCVMGHPARQGLRRWSLATSDAYGLYSQFGFTALANPEKFMELYDPDVYRSPP